MHHFGYIMTMGNNVLDFKQSLKKLKKKVKQLEAERDLNKSWNHKEILIDAKKKKLQMKQLLDELEEMRASDTSDEKLNKWIEERIGDDET